ncbi:MAG: hypothetical protein ACTHM1_08110 [Solirubrobacteraceae bacterium]
MAASASRAPGQLRRSYPPWHRRPQVYVACALLLAVLTVLWASSRATQGVRAELDARLRDAGAGADAALVTLEAEQLAAVRAVAFTEGVGGAMARGDAAALNRLVTPLQANSGVPMVDVVLPDGQVEFAVRSKGAPRPVASRAGMAAIAQALRSARGPRGGRFTTLEIFKSGPTIVTIGPVFDGHAQAGVVLAMTPLADALGRVSQEAGTQLTAYDSHGAPLATTASFDPRPLPATEAQALIGGGALVTRYVRDGQRETLGRLILDHQADAVLGVSLHDDSAATGRAVALYAGLGLLGTILILSAFWLRVTLRPRLP